MKENTIHITTATVHFYEKLCRFPGSRKYVWAIKLEDCSLFGFNSRIYIGLSSSYARSMKTVKAARHHLAVNRIFNGGKVSVIYNDAGIIAIGTNGADNYLDVNDNFQPKTFSQLGINIASLIVKN